jgi:3-(3-hydroxy-phenyl)propionate hydroxylase
MVHGVAKAAEATRVIQVTGDLADPKRVAARVRTVLRTLESLSSGSATSEDPAHDLLWSGEYEVHQRLARRFRVGRVLLAGDAAHLVHPSAADAVELGLQDVRNLAWKLAFTLRGYAPIRLLETYHGERRGAARRRLALGEEALHFLAPASPAQKVGRRLTLMGARGKGTTLRRLDPRGPAAGTSGPDYTGSPLLTPGPGVGEWIEDVPVVRADGAEGWLTECLDRGLVLMLIAPGIQVWHGDRWREAGLMPRLRARLDKLAAPAELVVTPEYPGAVAHTLLLIRPDGYVAAHLPPERLDVLEETIDRARGAK